MQYAMLPHYQFLLLAKSYITCVESLSARMSRMKKNAQASFPARSSQRGPGDSHRPAGTDPSRRAKRVTLPPSRQRGGEGQIQHSGQYAVTLPYTYADLFTTSNMTKKSNMQEHLSSYTGRHASTSIHLPCFTDERRRRAQ